jgi:thiol-disulfide isomerase/thioredoxin
LLNFKIKPLFDKCLDFEKDIKNREMLHVMTKETISKRILYTALTLVFGVLSVSLLRAEKPQTIPVYSFSEFEHWLNKDTDSVYVINFWATWCAPCVKEIPDFEKFNAKYKDQDVKVLFVSLDFPNQLESRVVPFVERMNMQAEVIMLNEPNANKWIPVVNDEWTGAIPATVIYGRGFYAFFEEELTFNDLEETILPLIQ